MWADQEFLEKCEQLAQAGYRPKLRPGMIVGRGFADVGSEVFTVHPGSKLLSLFTGKTSHITEAEEKKLFHIPSVDEFFGLLFEHGASITELHYDDGREFRLTATWVSGKKSTFARPTIEKLLLDVALECFNQEATQ